VQCFSLSNSELPFRTAPLLLVGENAVDDTKVRENNQHDQSIYASEFRKKDVRVDVYFDNEVKHWFCGWVSEVHPVQISILFANGDRSVRMKPVADQIRLSRHDPQLRIGSD
jgi:hypothetical protein